MSERSQIQALEEYRIRETIEEVHKAILPHFDYEVNPLEKGIEEIEADFINSYHLFKISKLTIPAEVENKAKYINDRFCNILSAAHKAGITLITIIRGEKGRTELFFGYKHETDKDPSVFQKIFEGVFKGSDIEYKEFHGAKEFFKDKKFGGLIAGIPTLKVEEERVNFDISHVIRSMYGEDFTLAIISTPVENSEIQKQWQGLLKIRDKCHSIAKTNITKEEGEGESTQHQESTTEGAKLKTLNFIFYSITSPKKGSVSKSTSESSGTEKHWSRSVSVEQLNSLALEYERLAEKFIERLNKSMSIGYWETTISFVTKTEKGRDILIGSFLGELSKPSVDNLPPRFVTAPLRGDSRILLPVKKEDSVSTIFPKSMCSYLSSEELAVIACPPVNSIPGYDVIPTPRFGLSDTPAKEGEGSFKLGDICDSGRPIESLSFTLSKDDLVKHTFVCGITGCGKTTTVKQILVNAKTPFLVLESAKRDYRKLLGNSNLKESLRVYTIGEPDISPIELNPFYILPGISPLSHIDYLKSIFNASFSLYGPMPHIVEKCLHSVYKKKGWNLTKGVHPFFMKNNETIDPERYKLDEHYFFFPTLEDLKAEVEDYIEQTSYRGELKDNIQAAIVTRLESLCVGAKGLMFNTYGMINIEELLNKPTIFEMEGLSDDDDKAFFVGLMLTFISEFRQLNNPATNPYTTQREKLSHLLVIEEAHRLLKNVQTERTSEMMGNPKGKAVEFFCNVIAEMRSLGQGVIVVEQIPSKIAPDVIKNTNTKIVHRLVSRDDQTLIAGSLSLPDETASYLNNLGTGFALCHKEGMNLPVEVKISGALNELSAVSNGKIARLMKKTVHLDYDLNEFAQAIGKDGRTLVIKLLNSLLTIKSEELVKLIKEAINELKKLYLRKNYREFSNEETIKKYIIIEMLRIFTNGIYQLDYQLLRGLKKLLSDIILKQNVSLLNNFKSRIKELANKSAEDFISERVANLVVAHLLDKKRVSSNDEDLRRLVKQCFLVEDENISEKILNTIRDMMEV